MLYTIILQYNFCGKAAACGFSYFNLLTIDKNLFIMS